MQNIPCFLWKNILGIFRQFFGSKWNFFYCIQKFIFELMWYSFFFQLKLSISECENDTKSAYNINPGKIQIILLYIICIFLIPCAEFWVFLFKVVWTLVKCSGNIYIHNIRIFNFQVNFLIKCAQDIHNYTIFFLIEQIKVK